MNHAGNARRDARNHVKIKFRVVAARNTLRELISDSHNASIRRVVTVPPSHPPPLLSRVNEVNVEKYRQSEKIKIIIKTVIIDSLLVSSFR